MDLIEGILARRTTNGAFLPDPVTREHQHLLMRVAAAAPSHFNSQPWRFVLIENRDTIHHVADIAGRSMQELIERGVFFERYRRYFRFTAAELDERRDGIFIDHLPAPLRPFTRQVFSDMGLKLMRQLGVPARLGEDNRKLVAGSPLLLAVLLDKNEHRPGELSGFYSQFGMGAAVGNIWNTVGTLGMGIQFISTPMELPHQWDAIRAIIRAPDDLDLMAVYRLGYLPEAERRPTIDWSSRHRKRLAQYVYRETCDTPERDPQPTP
ncbi:nitroreductase family protein [Deinococcus maricopensis]|uniref:Nitroreductase n=1 Tax=Deinococcus maricopensis (strain DSM 21211 / LMG 22137 / NRRL B-23946 / LB-34) TaxID=709986 RepID=E8U5S8_DEIML|nr:nitroreductase family protein [Deinococcus maricopensis]ADV66417.1 nitroreductase [Deinococcus maricopensis DSM 21211]